MKREYQMYAFLIVGALIVGAFWYVNRYVKSQTLSNAVQQPPTTDFGAE